MKPSERMRLHLTGEAPPVEEPPSVEEPPPEELSIADRVERLAELEREQMEARKQAAQLRSGRVVLGHYESRSGKRRRQKRL
jgi:hypothetical protein